MSQHPPFSCPSHALPSRSIPTVAYLPSTCAVAILHDQGLGLDVIFFARLYRRSVWPPSCCPRLAHPSQCNPFPPLGLRASFPAAESYLAIKTLLALARSRDALGSLFLLNLVCRASLPTCLADHFLAQEEFFSFTQLLASISTLPVLPIALSFVHPSSPSRPPSFSPLPPIATLLCARHPGRNDRSFAACLHPATPPSALIALDLTILTPTSARTAAGGVADCYIASRSECCTNSSCPRGVCTGPDGGVCEAAPASVKG